MSDQEHRSRVQRVFHKSMRVVLEPLISAGTEGIDMVGSNGDMRKVFPILCSYIADYPEQCLVTCTKYGTCPKCQAKAKDLQEPTPGEHRTPSWTKSIILEAKRKMSESNNNAKVFHNHCMDHEVSGSVYEPFWAKFPLCNIHQAIMPDVLHQLYQGVFKHIISWVQIVMTPAQLDQRIRMLPEAYGLHRFKNGFSALSQISGPERKQMAKILLGCLIGSIPKEGILAITAILDFIYIAQYSAHDDTTLGYLQDALDDFQRNRGYFIVVKIRKDFNIPKFHSLLHYVESIKMFGTTNNYNTEMFERLHIDFAKEAWRATNHRDEFPQMTRWLSRQEKMKQFKKHLNAQKTFSEESFHTSTRTSSTRTSSSQPSPTSTISIAKTPSFPQRDITLIENLHGCPDFSYYLKRYLNSLQETPQSHSYVDSRSLPFSKLDVYNMFRFHPEGIQDDEEEKDIVKAIPRSGKHPNGRFDTVLVIVGDMAESTGVEGVFVFPYALKVNLSICRIGTRVGRVRVIFTLPNNLPGGVFGPQATPASWNQGPLAFVEYLSSFPSSAHNYHGGMYHIKKVWGTGSDRRVPGEIVPLSSIHQSCMLFPFFKYDDVLDSTWRFDNILDHATDFLVNNRLSKYLYHTIW